METIDLIQRWGVFKGEVLSLQVAPAAQHPTQFLEIIEW